VCLGDRAGRKVRRGGGDGPVDRIEPALCAVAGGWSIHAGTRIERENRLGLERLARYGLRGPLANSRLEPAAHGRIAYHLPHYSARRIIPRRPPACALPRPWGGPGRAPEAG
jgi:hypothetical protein